jgi:four helix bundle protein
VNTIAELPNCGITELNPDNKSIQLKERTKTFANRVIRLFDALPKKTTAFVLGKQALRSETSLAANYRAACRSRFKAEFISRTGIVAEEADETVLWLELMIENRILPQHRLEPLLKEAKELTAIFTASQTTARRG